MSRAFKWLLVALFFVFALQFADDLWDTYKHPEGSHDRLHVVIVSLATKGRFPWAPTP